MKKADDFIPHMERAYRDAISSMQKDINDFFQRFVDNEGMTMTQARKLYTAREMKDFRMTLEEYIAKGQESGVSDKWLKELESASDLHRIDRLKALQLQLANEIESLSAYKEQELNKTLSDIYEEGYYRNIFDIQQINGVGSAFARIDKRKINQALSKPWTYDGKTFSDRIWQDKEKLKHSIEKTLTQSIIRGEAPLKTAKRIAKETNVELSSAKRLVLTESAAMSNKASMDSYKELGVDEIEFVSALDGRTCDICGAMDGKHFKTSEGVEGINLPPLHPNCRCTTVPYFNDEFTQGEMRAARDENGKTYYVPADMNCEEWKKEHVESSLNIPNITNQNGFTEKEFKSSLNDILDNSKGNENHIYNMKFYAETTDYIRNDKLSVPFAYLPKSDVIAYNPTNPYIKYYDMDYVKVHELTHRMDILQYHSWENKDFNAAIESSRQKVYDNFEEIQKLFISGGKYREDMILSDVMSALTNNEMELLYGHDEWGRIANEEQMEIFANISSMDILNKKYDEPINGALNILFEAYKGVVD